MPERSAPPTPTPERGLNQLEQHRIDELLDQLDASDPDFGPRVPPPRRRWGYRRRGLRITLDGGPSPATTLRVFTRALQESRLWFLSPTFCYPGTYCEVELLTVHNMWQRAVGSITQCRYVDIGIHELEVRFGQKLELALYVPQAIKRRVLVIDDEEISRALVAFHLEKLNASIKVLDSGAEASREVAAVDYDLVLLDLVMPHQDGFATLEQIRSAGYEGPVVALTAVLGPDQEAKCLQAGFDCYVPKPVTREKLARLLDTLHQEPIFSSMAQDTSMTELIARFVHSLRETARAMHPAVAHLDTAALAALARSLRVDAGGHGFEILAEKAALLERAATEGQPPETIGALARDVQSLCRLARATSSL